jgi:hypothetical protein
MYFMGLSATPFFKHWPEMKAEYDSIGMHNAWIETYKHSGEQMIKPLKVAERLKAAGLDPKTPPGTFQMRPLIYRMFVRQVEKLGVKIDFNSNVVDYFEDAESGKAGVVTKEGKRYEADMVIAADGVGSKSQKLVGGQVRAKSSGRAMWRAAFPIEHLDKNPEVKEHYKMVGENNDEPMVRTYLAPGAYALTLTRPDTMIWILNHDVSCLFSTRQSVTLLTSPRRTRTPPSRGATTSAPTTCSRASTMYPALTSGRPCSRSWSRSHLRTPSSTSSFFGVTRS